VFLPFSERSKDWERHGSALRKKAGLRAAEKLNPWALAPKIGLTVVNGWEAASWSNESDRHQLIVKDKYGWSGGVFPRPLPDGSFLCILNPTHSARRNKITLMEEIAHAHLGHKPSGLICISDGLQVRDYNRNQEQEAYGVGAAALIPWITLFPALNDGRSVNELAEDFEVTSDLIKYRIKITGGFRIYQARQRKMGRIRTDPPKV
jgi:hypothetical protein